MKKSESKPNTSTTVTTRGEEGVGAEVEVEVAETLVEETAVVAGIRPAVEINPRGMDTTADQLEEQSMALGKGTATNVGKPAITRLNVGEVKTARRCVLGVHSCQLEPVCRRESK